MSRENTLPPPPCLPQASFFLVLKQVYEQVLVSRGNKPPVRPPPLPTPLVYPPGADLFLVLHSPALLEIFALPEGSDVEGTVLVSVGASAVDGQHLLLLEREKGRGMLSLNAFTASWKPVSGGNIYLELV